MNSSTDLKAHLEREKNLVKASNELINTLKTGNTTEQLKAILSRTIDKNFPSEDKENRALLQEKQHQIMSRLNTLTSLPHSAETINKLYTSIYTKLNDFEQQAKQLNAPLLIKQKNIIALFNAMANQLGSMLGKIKTLKK